jgi:hypothetical protein
MRWKMVTSVPPASVRASSTSPLELRQCDLRRLLAGLIDCGPRHGGGVEGDSASRFDQELGVREPDRDRFGHELGFRIDQAVDAAGDVVEVAGDKRVGLLVGAVGECGALPRPESDQGSDRHHDRCHSKREEAGLDATRHPESPSSHRSPFHPDVWAAPP